MGLNFTVASFIRVVALATLVPSGGCLLTIDEARIDGSGGGATTGAMGGDGGKTPSGGAGGDGTGGGPVNLLINGSFEDWTAGEPLAWTPRGDEVIVESADAEDGVSSLEMELPSSYSGVSQGVGFLEPLPVGTVAMVSFWRKFISGPSDPGNLVFVFEYTDGTADDYIASEFNMSATWSLHEDQLTLEHPVDRIEVRIGNGAGADQVLRFDDVKLVITPP